MRLKISLSNLFIFLLFSALFYLTLRPIIDPDFWWHLRTGQLMTESGAIPQADPFSFTMQGQAWTTHEWLSELLFYQVYKIGGFEFLTVLFSLLITGAYALAYLRSPKPARPYVAGFVTLLAAVASGPVWGVRPQMLTLLFFSLYLFLLDRYRASGNFKLLIPLPFLMILWVNLHAGYILGLVLILVYLLGWAIELGCHRIRHNDAENQPSEGKALKNLAFAFLATSAAIALNPSGLKMFVYPFQTLFDPAMQAYIQEWMTPNFHETMWFPLAALLLSLIGIGMLGGKRLNLIQITLTLGFGFAALQSARHVPLFAIVVIPIMAEQLGNLIKFKPSERPVRGPMQILNGLLIAIVIALLIFALLQLPAQQRKGIADNYPVAAVDWISRENPPGRMFNSYSWGGYLIWRLYPTDPVYIDGRADVYGSKFFSDYVKIASAQRGWERALNQQQIGFVLIEPDSNLAESLRQSPAWKVSFEDTKAVIFTRN